MLCTGEMVQETKHLPGKYENRDSVDQHPLSNLGWHDSLLVIPTLRKLRQAD